MGRRGRGAGVGGRGRPLPEGVGPPRRGGPGPARAPPPPPAAGPAPHLGCRPAGGRGRRDRQRVPHRTRVMASHPDDPEALRQLPVGDLVKQLAEETSLLVRQEIELARTEMTLKAKRAGIGLGELGGAGIVALLAIGALTACLIAALALAMPVWAAALIVAVVYGAVAGVLAVVGRRQLQRGLPPTPERTQQTIKEDIEWAKTQKPSSRT